MRRFILIPHLRIQNANAISSPYAIGFPAITAWMGAVHALERYLHNQGLPQVNFKKIAVSCHTCDLQTYKGQRDFVHSIVGTSNPLDKDGDRAPFIEEARCHTEVSLLVEYDKLDINDDKNRQFENLINARIPCMKWAGGDLVTVKPVSVKLFNIDEDIDKDFKKSLRLLMPGHVLIERRDLMINSMVEGNDALDALLNHLKIMNRSSPNKEDSINWTSTRKESGWLVPIAVGFQGISTISNKAINQRDENTSHRFAESVTTLGEFIMPYRIRNLDD